MIRSTNLDETINITNSAYSSWRPHKNNVANKIAFLQTIAGQTHLMTADLNGENKQQISQVPLNGFRSKDRKSTRLNSSHVASSYAVFCLKKKTNKNKSTTQDEKT